MNRMMARLLAGRLVVAVLTLLFISLVVFFVTNLLPGDAAQVALGQSATPQAIAGLRKAMHLDAPAYQRYLTWLLGMLQGNPGLSLVNRVPITTLMAGRLANTLLLAGVTTAFSVPLALLVGITSAVYQGSPYDRVVNMLTVSTVSVPEFLVATVAVLIFAVKLRWFPSIVYGADIHTLGEFLRAYAMPVVSLSFVVSAQMIRMTRAAVIDTLRSSYIEMAVLKGVPQRRIVLSHALPNAIGPIANAAALSLGYLIGGVIIVETIFSYPGVAKLMVDAVATRDMPLIQACAMLFCTAHLLLVTLADVCAILSNPRLWRQ